MKQLVLLSLLLVSSYLVVGQNYHQADSIPPFDTLRIAAKYVNSPKNFVEINSKPAPLFDVDSFVKENLRYPAAAKRFEISGEVHISFHVNVDGSISNIRAINKPIGYSLEEEAVRVVSLFPKFKPAIRNGQAQVTGLILPIRFKLSSESYSANEKERTVDE